MLVDEVLVEDAMGDSEISTCWLAFTCPSTCFWNTFYPSRASFVVNITPPVDVLIMTPPESADVLFIDCCPYIAVQPSIHDPQVTVLTQDFICGERM